MQVAPPDAPRMRAAAFPERVFDVVLGQKFRERFGRRKRAVLATTAYPQHSNLLVGGLRLPREARVGLWKIRCGSQARTETGDVTEQIEIVQPYAQRLTSAH